MKLKIDWEKAADSLAADMRRQKVEIARMRPVFRAVGGWYRNAYEEICENSKPMVSEIRLARAYARAVRKAKGK